MDRSDGKFPIFFRVALLAIAARKGSRIRKEEEEGERKKTGRGGIRGEEEYGEKRKTRRTYEGSLCGAQTIAMLSGSIT